MFTKELESDMNKGDLIKKIILTFLIQKGDPSIKKGDAIFNLILDVIFPKSLNVMGDGKPKSWEAVQKGDPVILETFQ